LDDLRLASDLKLTRYTKELKKCNLLIIDDWMLSEIDEIETQFLYELIHDRELTEGTSTMLCTQYDLNGCAMKMANRTMSDAIYDRLEHNAYIVDLSQNPNYPSMRERYGRNKRPI
jgi:DNA replication protein DnaC